MFTPSKPNKKYPDATAVIAVSMDSDDFQGKKLQKLLMHAQEYGKIRLVLGDGTLHAKTLKIFYPTLSDEELLKMSNEKGNTWWHDNIAIIKEHLGKPVEGHEEPKHWDWTNRKDYQALLANFKEDLEKDPKGRMARALNKTLKKVEKRFHEQLGVTLVQTLFSKEKIDQKVRKIMREKDTSLGKAEKLFLEPYIKQAVNQLKEKYGDDFITTLILAYLLEETTIIHIAKYWREELSCEYILYPNEITDILKLASIIAGDMHWVNTNKQKKSTIDLNGLIQTMLFPPPPSTNSNNGRKKKTSRKDMEFETTLLLQCFHMFTSIRKLPKEAQKLFFVQFFNVAQQLVPEDVINIVRKEADANNPQNKKNVTFRITEEEETSPVFGLTV